MKYKLWLPKAIQIVCWSDILAVDWSSAQAGLSAARRCCNFVTSVDLLLVGVKKFFIYDIIIVISLYFSKIKNSLIQL